MKPRRKALAELERAFSVGWNVGAGKRRATLSSQKHGAWQALVTRLEELSTKSVDSLVHRVRDSPAIKPLRELRKK